MATAVTHPGLPATAHDRLKQRSRTWFWEALALATLIHFLFLALGPTFRPDDLSFAGSELSMIELPPEVEIPPPPVQIARPAPPVISDRMDIPDDITIAPTTFDQNTPISTLPAPKPTAPTEEIARAPVYTPFTLAPRLLNREEVIAALTANYPPLLRDAGIGGTVVVWFFIDEHGIVRNSLVNQPSEFRPFNDAALKVATVMRFSPAQNRDKLVPVWVALPVTFAVK